MITVYKENGKSLKEKSSDTIADIVNEARIELNEAVCGNCKSKGNFKYYCEYVRTITYIEEGVVKSLKLKLQRYKCLICGKTHVIAPGTQVVPYGRYCLGFILYVFAAYIMRELPVRQIAEKYMISVSTIYVWIKKFKKHYKWLKGALTSKENEFSKMIEDISNDKQISSRLFSFVKTYRIGFMQETQRDKTTNYFVLTGYLIELSRGSP